MLKIATIIHGVMESDKPLSSLTTLPFPSLPFPSRLPRLLLQLRGRRWRGHCWRRAAPQVSRLKQLHHQPPLSSHHRHRGHAAATTATAAGSFGRRSNRRSSSLLCDCPLFRRLHSGSGAHGSALSTVAAPSSTAHAPHHPGTMEPSHAHHIPAGHRHDQQRKHNTNTNTNTDSNTDSTCLARFYNYPLNRRTPCSESDFRCGAGVQPRRCTDRPSPSCHRRPWLPAACCWRAGTGARSG